MCRWEHLSLKRKRCSMESLNPRRSLSIGPGGSSPRDPPNREESIEDGECGGYGSIPTLLPPGSGRRRTESTPKASTRRAWDRESLPAIVSYTSKHSQPFHIG